MSKSKRRKTAAMVESTHRPPSIPAHRHLLTVDVVRVPLTTHPPLALRTAPCGHPAHMLTVWAPCDALVDQPASGAGRHCDLYWRAAMRAKGAQHQRGDRVTLEDLWKLVRRQFVVIGLCAVLGLVLAVGWMPVSYTHLTLPTICSV